MMNFPSIGNSGKAKVEGAQVTFSYLDSYGATQTETKPVLTAQEVLNLVMGRMGRFEARDEFVRESDFSRSERKYIAAQPEATLQEAWKLLDDMGKMEMSMMLDKNSHHGISDPKWLAKHSKPLQMVEGDDGVPFNLPPAAEAQQSAYDTAFKEAAGV